MDSSGGAEDRAALVIAAAEGMYTVIALLFSIALTASACGSSDAADSIDTAEGQAIEASVSRVDLEVRAEAVPNDGGSGYRVEAAMRSLDTGTFFSPTLLIDASPGVSLAEPMPERCVPGVVSALACELINFYSSETSPIAPTIWFEILFDVNVDEASPGPHTITFTGVSRLNPVDNDPDPTNNVIELTLEPAAAVEVDDGGSTDSDG